MLFVDNSRAEKKEQREVPRLQSVVPDSWWQAAVSFENCRNLDLSRVPSHLVSFWRRFQDRVRTVASHGIPTLRGQTQQRVTCVHTRRASTQCPMATTRFLKPYFFLASSPIDGFEPLGILSAAAFADLLGRRSRRQQPKVEACRLGRHMPFQTVRVG